MLEKIGLVALGALATALIMGFFLVKASNQASFYAGQIQIVAASQQRQVTQEQKPGEVRR